jgi:glucose-1-phosphate cytidylyltransferase
MKVAILAGGAGSRLAEETHLRPKPMVEIGDKPILWHIIRHYYHHGLKQFVIALGYKGDYIKNYMESYCKNNSNVTVNFQTQEIEYQNSNELDWKVELIETGLKTMTGGRIKRLRPFLGDDTFMLTWGDGVPNVDLHKLIEFHRSHGKLATVTAVRPPARYGYMEFDGDRVVQFAEKPQAKEGWINGAFFVLEPGVFDYIDGDEQMFEQEPMERLAQNNQLMAYKHNSFWQCMDTLREKHLLESLWNSGEAPWKMWK